MASHLNNKCVKDVLLYVCMPIRDQSPLLVILYTIARQPAMMRNEHLKNLQEIIVTEQQAEQASGGHDDGDDNGSEVEEAVALIGKLVCVTCSHISRCRGY